MKLRRLLLVVAAVLVILAPAALFCVQKVMHAGLPAWLSTEEAVYLSGGVSDVDLSAEATLEGLKSGTFQRALEAEIGNYIPAKAAVLIGNAALQRGAISLSDSLFGWGCYPTFYGSSTLYLPEYEFLTSQPIRDTEETLVLLKKFAEAAAQFAIEHPDKAIHVVVPDSAHLSTPLAPSRLVHDPLDAETVSEIISASWDDVPNLALSIATYDNPDQFINDFYHTDGHWNGYGALRAYESLESELPQLDAVDVHNSVIGPVFNGQNARHGLMLLDYPAIEPNLDTLSVAVESGAVGWLLSEDPSSVFEEHPLEAEFNFYASWYGRDADAVILNDEKEGDVLLISDSFGDAFRWLLAQSFHRVSNYMDLRAANQGGVTLQERIDQSEADTVVFVAQPSDYLGFLERCPNYFS